MKNVIIFIFLFGFFFILPMPSYAYNEDFIVCVTKTGDCYHLDKCSYLKSKIEMTLEQAINAGYRACSRCDPPTLTDMNVVLNKYSSDYWEEVEEKHILSLESENEELENEVRKLKSEAYVSEKEYYNLQRNVPKYCAFSFAGGIFIALLFQYKKKQKVRRTVTLEAEIKTTVQDKVLESHAYKIKAQPPPVNIGQKLYYQDKNTGEICFTEVVSIHSDDTFAVKWKSRYLTLPFSALNKRLYVTPDIIPKRLCNGEIANKYE